MHYGSHGNKTIPGLESGRVFRERQIMTLSHLLSQYLPFMSIVFVVQLSCCSSDHGGLPAVPPSMASYNVFIKNQPGPRQ